MFELLGSLVSILDRLINGDTSDAANIVWYE